MTTDRPSRAVVVGAAGAIGWATTQVLRARGMSVVGWDLSASPDSAAGPHLVCDITDPEQVGAAASTSNRLMGGIDALVNTAGLGQLKPFSAVEPDQFDRIIQVNLVGAANCMRAVLPEMVTRAWGIIVNVCSVWSTQSGSSRSAYVASKWGLLGLTKSLAEEYRHSGVCICAVSPGPVVSNLSSAMMPDQPGGEGWMQPTGVAAVISSILELGYGLFSGSEIQMYGFARPSVGITSKGLRSNRRLAE